MASVERRLALKPTSIRCNENTVQTSKETEMTSGDRLPPLATFDRHFSRNMPFTRFALNVLLFSCLGLVPFLILYISLRPSFWSSLIADPLARDLLLRQVVTNGLPVVYLINHVSFSLYAGLTGRECGALRAFAIDVLANRAVLRRACRDICGLGAHIRFVRRRCHAGSRGGGADDRRLRLIRQSLWRLSLCYRDKRLSAFHRGHAAVGRHTAQPPSAS